MPCLSFSWPSVVRITPSGSWLMGCRHTPISTGSLPYNTSPIWRLTVTSVWPLWLCSDPGPEADPHSHHKVRHTGFNSELMLININLMFAYIAPVFILQMIILIFILYYALYIFRTLCLGKMKPGLQIITQTCLNSLNWKCVYLTECSWERKTVQWWIWKN